MKNTNLDFTLHSQKLQFSKLTLLLIAAIQICLIHYSKAETLSQLQSISGEADLHSGSATTSFSIQVPPGRAGLQPALSPIYRSNLPNGILGVGWELDFGTISRSTRNGTPTFDDDLDTFILRRDGGAKELIRNSNTGLFHLKEESSFMRIEKRGDHWVLTDRAGTRYYYGLTTDSRLYNRGITENIYSWSVERVEDVHGNYMLYGYKHDVHNHFLYPQFIRYTGFQSDSKSLPTFAEIRITTEMRPDLGPEQFIKGFHSIMNRRIKSFEVLANGVLQRKYELEYSQSQRSGRSLLSSVTQIAANGEKLPPLTFEYQGTQNPTYSVVSISGGNSQENFRWTAQSTGGYDRGGSNYGPVHPNSIGNAGFANLSWSNAQASSGGTWGNNGSWSNSNNGSLTINGVKDAAYWFWTYVYSPRNQTLPVTITKGGSGVVGVYVNENVNDVAGNWTLREGINLVQVTAYDQSSNFSATINLNLPRLEVTNSSKQISPRPRVSADFNADGKTDLATIFPDQGKVDVWLSSGGAFQAPKNWISNFGTQQKLVIGDFNGDGRSDLCAFNSSSGSWRVALSDGARFIDNGIWLNAFSGNSNSPGVGDFNGDGRIDIYIPYDIGSNNLGMQIAESRGDSFEIVTVENPNPNNDPNPVLSNAGDVSFISDFNGDRLRDIGVFDSVEGNWHIKARNHQPGIDFTLIGVTHDFGTQKQFLSNDFNSDGIADVAYYEPSSGKIRYQAYNGTRRVRGEPFSSTFELPFNFSIRSSSASIQAGDFNGDSISDYLIYDSQNGASEIAYSSGKATDLLVKIDNGLGAETSISYSNSLSFPDSNLPFPMQVVSSITRSDSKSSITRLTSYSGGRWDHEQQEFLGFAEVSSSNSNGTTTTTQFDQARPFRGRVLNEEIKDSTGVIHKRTENIWNAEEIHPGVDFVYLKRSDTWVFNTNESNQDSDLRTAVEYSYDEPQLGNLTSVTHYGEVDVNSGDDIGTDSRTVKTEYLNNESDWIIGLAKTTSAFNHQGQLMRRSSLFYDYQENHSSVPVLGLLTKRKELAGNGQENPVTQWEFDDMGQLVRTIDPNGGISSIEYDNLTNTFPTASTDALGLKVSTHTYGVNESSRHQLRGLFGQKQLTIDPNNQETQSGFDVFGRPSIAISPKGSASDPSSLIEYEIHDNYSTDTTFKVVEGVQSIKTVKFYDGFGRLLLSKEQSDEEGLFVVIGQVEYNELGLAYKQYLPYYSSEDPYFLEPVDPTRPHSTQNFDELNRVVKTINPDGTFATITYNPRVTIYVNENGHQRSVKSDAFGRVIEKTNYSGADGRSSHYPQQNFSPYATSRYEYNSEGDLVKLIDAEDNVTAIEYDLLSRKLKLTEPNSGTWEYQYDPKDNLISLTNPKGQIIFYEYDRRGRLTRKHSESGNLDVRYEHDAVEKDHSQGRLTKVTYPGGEADFFYDNTGEQIRIEKQIGNQRLTLNREFDQRNQLRGLILPDGSRLSYQLNAADQITAIASDLSLLENEDIPEAIVGHQERVANNHPPADLPILESACSGFRRGDVNTDNRVDIGDAIFLLKYLYLGEKGLNCIEALDVNGSESVDLSDAIYLLNYLFLGGDRPVFPFPEPFPEPLKKPSIEFLSSNNGIVELSWCSVNNAAEYIVWYGESAENLSNFFGPLTTNQATIPNLDPSATYYFSVEARDSYQKSHPSEVKSITLEKPDRLYIRSVSYNVFGQPEEIEYGNGVRRIYTYCPINFRLMQDQIWDASGKEISNLNYEYDSKGLLLQISDLTNQKAERYRYDFLDRLIQAEGPHYGVRTYAYSKSGRLLRKGEKTYFYDSPFPHAVSSIAEEDQVINYTYDACGRRSEKETNGNSLQYEYSVEGQLISIHQNESVLAEYDYDGDGGRTAQRVYTYPNGVNDKPEMESTIFFGNLYQAVNGQVSKNIYLGGKLVATVKAGSISFQHTNHLNSVMLSTDSSGEAESFRSYTPFGELAYQENLKENTVGTELGFTGQRLDSHSGLNYFRARYYDPSIGSFITPDSITPNPFDTQINPFALSRNNPIIISDNTGHFFFGVFAAVAAAVKSFASFAIAHPIIGGAITGGVFGGVRAAINGTNIAKGIGIGALTGGVASAVSVASTGFLEGIIGTTGAGLVGEQLGGAAASAITSALIGGEGGLDALAGFAGSLISFGGQRIWPLGADALAGGVSSAIRGGSFEEGVKQGAFSNALATTIDLLTPSATLGELDTQEGDLIYFKANSPIGLAISYFEGGAFSHVGIKIDNDTILSATWQKPAGMDRNGIRKQSISPYTDEGRKLFYRQAKVQTNFRGNKNLIRAATNLANSPLPITYGFFPNQAVCSTTCGKAINNSGNTMWTGIGPNSLYHVMSTYGE